MLNQSIRRRAFTLIELLVVVSIIGLLIAIVVPSLSAARRTAKRTICAANLHQIGVATSCYLNDYNDTFYWRAANVGLDGMDWYVYGGRCPGNAFLGQGGLFNNTAYRPINKYTEGNVEIFRCPLDTDPVAWAQGNTHYDYVGNSYTFNCLGYPLIPGGGGPTEGLAGRRAAAIAKPTQTIVYLDTAMHKAPGAWHGDNGNIVMADWHISFMAMPTDADPYYTWNP